jgi:TonB family protein
MRNPLRREFALAVLAFSTAFLAAAQQSAPPTLPTAAPAQSTNTAPASGVSPASGTTSPSDNAAGQITPPIVITQPSPDYPYEAREKKIGGRCLVSFTVDADGIPRNVRVVNGLEPSLDANAVQTIETWRFKPAIRDGKTPVPFDLTAEVSFRLFNTQKSGSVIAIPARPDEPGTLLSYDGSRVIPPIAIKAIAPKYPFMDRVRRISGDCTLGMIVDSEGVPRNVHVVKSVDPRLDESAVKAVMKWRYKPALKDGVPVPSEMIVIVKFQMV